ncbi:hypothetical protein SMGD1_1627 [Sulfurimonas gotlandica GD1]|jgi:hypothetical protein|uniref:Porin n=1 Tax=Sulfurimonas gotlandica (strain DSM 19862 / JCM 16533 / GD1) TaxID=929558 RepID=B6BHZ9_SULGG|nr:hypothetical protein [Sulfurimonas gotlandica]EDZ63438.1 conserved hypothetical protein [Sulfurimonas gotlandica GD1]EHP30151.1 hypothetical protein SMGD1_1627 [Sulfurimonas gotlandica GD1]
MKKIVLSALAALTIGTVAASAGDVKFYTDGNGQVFTTAGEGRTEIKSKKTPVFSHADKLKFSGLTYIGYTYNDYKDGLTSDNVTAYQSDTSQFELRRAYFQLKAYLLDDPKSYYRVTFDMYQNTEKDMVVRAKYAYLYLNEVLPFTGVEIGLVHRPWHDYEEHNAWYYRNISKVLIEAKNAGDLSNSADYGVNFKTKTKYFDSEIGLFNGEGYHATQATGTGMSLEWRATAHLLGVNGKDKQTIKTYLDASFFGQYNQEHKANAAAPSGFDDLIFTGLHTVYNQPEFLISAQYVLSNDTAENSTYVSKQAGSGYSVNGEYRLGDKKEYRAIARYDSWTDKKATSSAEKADKAYIVGGVWEQSHNVQWVANAIVTDNEAGSDREKYNGVAYMLTAEVKF